ncbi:hypothetical protein niasHT_037393 [Heterodera trifolii]|uniref:Uncharacterized protein n=1 Tax=Heterodera trifolii TaxID=157864 RepID=A0ABD2J476_9BILA
MSSTQKIWIQFFINAVVAKLCLSACNPTMLFREMVNAQPIADIYKKWQGKDTPGCPCVYVICSENKADIYLLNGYRTGGCQAAITELKPTCQKAGQQLSCLECEGAGCMPRLLQLQDAPTTPRPEWMDVIESCKKYEADCHPCGWAKCVSYPGWAASGCCLSGYIRRCCSYVLPPPGPGWLDDPTKPTIPPPEPEPEPIETTTKTETPAIKISPKANATEEPNTAVTLLTSKMCIALASLLMMVLHFGNDHNQF